MNKKKRVNNTLFSLFSKKKIKVNNLSKRKKEKNINGSMSKRKYT